MDNSAMSTTQTGAKATLTSIKRLSLQCIRPVDGYSAVSFSRFRSKCDATQAQSTEQV